MNRTTRQKIIYDIRRGYTTAEIAERRGVEREYVSKIRGALSSADRAAAAARKPMRGQPKERIKEPTFKTGFAAVAMYNGKRPRRVGFRFYKMDTQGVTPDGITIYAAEQLP